MKKRGHPLPTARSYVLASVLSTRLLHLQRQLWDWRSRLSTRADELVLYYQPGDPHSHLCAQLVLPLAERLAIPVVVKVVPPPADSSYPEREKQIQHAINDARYLAAAYGLTLPTGISPPDDASRMLASRVLLAAENVADFVAREAEIIPALWRNDCDTLQAAANAQNVPDQSVAEQGLAQHQQERSQRGHYLPAMWFFRGEWFWALDRLGFLEARLRDTGVLQGDAPLAYFVPEAVELPSIMPETPLEIFYSFRSPYSYLVVERIIALAQRYQCEVSVRPVLPMVMRGLAVPRAKQLYIARDAKRVSQQLQIPFGQIADPVGKPAERCLASFGAAEGYEQQLAFLHSVGNAIWAEGIDVGTDAGLRYAVERAGLSWATVAERLKTPDLQYAEDNRVDLLAMGLWGVPSFRLGGLITWGQDRVWLLEQALKNRYD